MASIGWAVSWIKEGRVVKRAAWDYEDVWDGLRVDRGRLLGRTGLIYEDLIADDWEFAFTKLSSGKV